MGFFCAYRTSLLWRYDPISSDQCQAKYVIEFTNTWTKFDINRENIEDFSNERKEFHDNFRDCFSRSESRGHFYRYMVGQFSELERKSIEPIALTVKDGNIKIMQHFVGDVNWDDNKILTNLGLDQQGLIVASDLAESWHVLGWDAPPVQVPVLI